ncbi:MAG: sulfite exporter TauE/SafE family protein [Xanthobacteraceae bacterium]
MHFEVQNLLHLVLTQPGVWLDSTLNAMTIPKNPWFYAVGLTAIFVMSIGKGAFGGGLTLLGIPLLSFVMSPMEAAVVMAPMALLMDVFGFSGYRISGISKPDVGWLMPPIVIGLALGFIFFVWVDPKTVSAVIGILCFVFSADWFVRGRRKSELTGRSLFSPLAVVTGYAFGFSTFIAHAGGPILSAYLLHRGLSKEKYIATIGTIFSVVNLLKLFPYAIIGMGVPNAIVYFIMLAPAVPFGVFLGTYIHGRLDQQRILFWCYLLMLFAAGKLMYDTLHAWMYI